MSQRQRQLQTAFWRILFPEDQLVASVANCRSKQFVSGLLKSY